MKAVFDFVQGRLSYDDFEIEFLLNPELWTWIQDLVPDDISDRNCRFRSIYQNIQAFETNNYNVRATIMAFGYDNIYGHSIAHTLISALIKYHYPNIICSKPIERSAVDVLGTLHLDYLGGNDVDEMITDVIALYHDDMNAIKKQLKEKFHLTSRKHPIWVQEPEWPAVDGNPLKFMSQTSEGEKYIYTFLDINTQETKNIIQYM